MPEPTGALPDGIEDAEPPAAFESSAERELALAKLEAAVLGSAPTQLGPLKGLAKLGPLGRGFRGRDSSPTREGAAKVTTLLRREGEVGASSV